LPEAQLDRFLLQIDVGYPDDAAERRMMIETTSVDQVAPRTIFSGDELIEAQKLVRQVPVGEAVVDAILTLVRNGRPESSEISEVISHVAWGPGPRASQSLMLACRAKALLEGRFSPSVDDVISLAAPVLRHRMALNFAARAEGITVETVIGRLLDTIQ
jgi:MoxR-like ATPase